MLKQYDNGQFKIINDILVRWLLGNRIMVLSVNNGVIFLFLDEMSAQKIWQALCLYFGVNRTFFQHLDTLFRGLYKTILLWLSNSDLDIASLTGFPATERKDLSQRERPHPSHSFFNITTETGSNWRTARGTWSVVSQTTQFSYSLQ